MTQTALKAASTNYRSDFGRPGMTLHDLCGTAVTMLFLAGCTEAEIATITGHALKDVRSILDANHFHRETRLGESGIDKLGRDCRDDEAPPAPDRIAPPKARPKLVAALAGNPPHSRASAARKLPVDRMASFAEVS